ncbi:MAG: hypothetical protein WBC71_07120 [Salaquimonas sp.]
MANTIEDTARLMGRNHDIRFDRLMPGYHDRLQQSAQTDKKPITSATFPALVIKLCVLMALAAAVIFSAASFYGSIIAQGGHSSSVEIHQVVIGDDVISVPENMIRFRSQRNQNNLSRLDLYAHWPSMQGYNPGNAGIFDSPDTGMPILFVSLEPRDMTKDMSGRISSIYGNFFAGPPIDAGNGLVRRPFSSESAYFSEDLYYEANSPYPFAARCVRQSKQISDPFCIRDIHIGRDMMLTYRFHISLLPDWLAMDRAVRETYSAMLSK